MTSNNKKTMHKTIKDVNLGLSNLNLVVDAQSQNPLETFQAVYKYLNEVATIEYSSPRSGVIEYLGKNEDCLIRLNSEDWRLMLAKYCSNGKLLGTFNFFIELRDTNENDCGWSVYKFVDVTPRKQN